MDKVRAFTPLQRQRSPRNRGIGGISKPTGWRRIRGNWSSLPVSGPPEAQLPERAFKNRLRFVQRPAGEHITICVLRGEMFVRSSQACEIDHGLTLGFIFAVTPGEVLRKLAFGRVLHGA
ncbi:MAG: hypothetical protein ACK4WH_11475 [Phycisphaerales bacterium]